ncbi:hypothetical protein Z947_2117 [Sulfitobacter geojensis]|nr:hypothetical protein Z947_2117 [Sulfitobacter geojensis]
MHLKCLYSPMICPISATFEDDKGRKKKSAHMFWDALDGFGWKG